MKNVFFFAPSLNFKKMAFMPEPFFLDYQAWIFMYVLNSKYKTAIFFETLVDKGFHIKYRAVFFNK